MLTKGDFIMEKHKSCTFLGHRDTELTEQEKQHLKEIIFMLISECDCLNFLFGSRSKFISSCLEIVTEFKKIFPNICRIKYNCKSETAILEPEKEKWEKIYSNLEKKDVKLLCYDKQVDHKTMLVAGMASYIERNNEMIDASDYCVFYYDPNYESKIKSTSRFGIGYQPKSGTALAFEYAVKKKKHIINVCKK